MKAKTQLDAMTQALIAGEKLTALTSFKDFGSLRLGGQMFHLQKKYGIMLNKRNLKGKTRFGTTYHITEYAMSRTDARMVKKAMK